MQTAAPGQYKGALDVVKQTLARDGVKGFVRSAPARPLTLPSFYRGMGPPIMGVAPMFAVSFWVSDF